MYKRQLQIDGLAAGTAREWGEVVRPTGADVQATFVGGVLDGLPAITRHAHGDGTAWYVATAPDDLTSVLDAVLEGTGVAPVVADLPLGVEAVERGDHLFLLNHTAESVTVGDVALAPYAAAVVGREARPA